MEITKCPACGKQHTVLRVLDTIPVIICVLIKDIIYINCTVDKATREIVKRELGL